MGGLCSDTGSDATTEAVVGAPPQPAKREDRPVEIPGFPPADADEEKFNEMVASINVPKDDVRVSGSHNSSIEEETAAGTVQLRGP